MPNEPGLPTIFYGTPETPGPAPLAAAGEALELIVGVRPATDGADVLVERSVGGQALPPLRAWPRGLDPETGAQLFAARLPALSPGQSLDYQPILVRGAETIARAERSTVSARGGSVSPRTGPPVFAPPAPTPRMQAAIPPVSGVPRFNHRLEFLGALTVQLASVPEVIGPTPAGLHVNFYIAAGQVVGPRLNTTILPEGGDWMLIRPDGIGVCNVRLTHQTPDGALLLSDYSGIFDLGEDGYARALENDFDPLPPLITVPQLITSHPDWRWVNRLQMTGIGKVDMKELLVMFDMYAIRVL